MVTLIELLKAVALTAVLALVSAVVGTYTFTTANLPDYAIVGGFTASVVSGIVAAVLVAVTVITYVHARRAQIAFIAK